MKIRKIGALLALLLTSCGGEGGSDGASGMPATPTPTASPTPVPPVGKTTGELKPSSDAVVNAATLEFTRTAAATSARSSDAEILFQLNYSAGSNTYTLTDAARTRAFSLAQFDEETSVPDTFPHVSFSLPGVDQFDYLLIAKAPNASPVVVPKYGAYGAWQHNTTQAGATRIRLNYFTYGSPTPAASMPRTGLVRFRIPGTGNYARDDGLFLTQSDTFIDVDFAARTVFGVPTLSGDDFITGGFGGLIGFRVGGTIVGNTVTADIDSDIATVRGRFRMIFYGPNADELALIISGGNDQARFVTAGVGVRYP